MTRRSWWLFSSRKGLIILCLIVVLGISFWTGWSLDHRFGEALVVALYQGFACILIVLAMALVRKMFEFRSVRTLFDVLAVVLWAMIVLTDLRILTADTSNWGTERREDLEMALMFTILHLVGSFLIVTVLGLSLKLWTRFFGRKNGRFMDLLEQAKKR